MEITNKKYINLKIKYYIQKIYGACKNFNQILKKQKGNHNNFLRKTIKFKVNLTLKLTSKQKFV